MSKIKNDDSNQPQFAFSSVEIDLNRFTREPDTEALPLIATRNLVLFPGMTITLDLGRQASAMVAEYGQKSEEPIGIVCQQNPEDEFPSVTTGLYKYGAIADILKVIKRPDGNLSALARARGRFRIIGRGKHPEFLSARIKLLPEIVDFAESETPTVVSKQLDKLCYEAFANTDDLDQFFQAVKSFSDVVEKINFLCTNLPIDTATKASLLARSHISQRYEILLNELSTLVSQRSLAEEVMQRAKISFDENKKRAFLQQQMDAIRETLYGDEQEEVDELLSRAQEAGMPEKVMKTFEREAEKMRRYNPNSPDYAVQYTYLDILCSMPWAKATTSRPTLAKAKKILEEDHFGLEKVKERILEQLALLMRVPTGKAPILCLVGPPGVGKTSIGRSVASALERKYERVSFGGLHDEAEIRGHRRTYIGAMPGRIIDAIKKTGVNNPVLVLDEIDKIGADYKGDPAAALLEVLDPEQNSHFHDNYLDVDFDLSKVLFIATANTLSTVARPLLDRMEIIDISGYLLEEKMEIAKRHLLPRIRQNHKLSEDEFSLTDAALERIIREYTAESGVRLLEKRLSSVARKSVLAIAKKSPLTMPIDEGDLYSLLGLAPYRADSYEGNDLAGVVTGLAWTEVGGDILLAEASLTEAKEPRLTITGNLGDVMKESASIAYQWVKAHSKAIGIKDGLLDKYSIHIHFPEGAIPKDGPSAGITIATAIVSAFTQHRVAERLAMTGEITLRGRVLPVGGIREKILAAKRAGIKRIIMSKDNQRDIDDMPKAYTDGLEFTYVSTVNEVIASAITDQLVANPIEL